MNSLVGSDRQRQYSWGDTLEVVLSSGESIPVKLSSVKNSPSVGYVCSSCKSPTSLAEGKCGSCGSPFEPLELEEARELFPQVAVIDTDANRVAYLLLHRAWICLYCNSYNVNFPRTGSSGEGICCINCGGGYERGKSILLEDSDALDTSEASIANFRAKVLAIIESRQPKKPGHTPTYNPPPRTLSGSGVTSLYPPRNDRGGGNRIEQEPQFQSRVTAHPSSRNKWMIITGALGGVLVVSYLVYEGFIKEHDAEITILGHDWERVVRIEKYDERTGSDWKKDVNPNNYAGFRVTNSVLKEASWDSYEVQVGMKSVEDTSKCLSWNKSCSTPKITLSSGKTVDGKETCVRSSCAVHGTKLVPDKEKRYRKHTYIEFRYMDWGAHLSLPTTGTDKKPYWQSTANYTIDNTTLRLGAKSETYRVSLTDEKGNKEMLSLPFEVWNKLSVGSNCSVKATNWGGVVTSSVKAAVENCIEK